MTPADRVAAALRDLVPADVRAGARPVSSGRPSSLVGEEARHVARAIGRRREEFAAGRALLRELTGTTGAIGVLSNRAPAAPRDWVVSLAHDREVVAAVAAPASATRSLGVDIEPVAPLDAGVAEVVLRPDDPDIDPLLAFVAKEAAYKAWSSPDRRILEHHDVRLCLEDVSGRFAAEVVASDVPTAVLHGRFAQAADRWLAVVT